MGGTEENEGGELEFSMASNLVDEEKQSVSEAHHNQKISQSMVVEEISNSRENGHSTLEKETTHNGKKGEMQSFSTQSPSADAIDADAVPVENDQGNSGIVELAAVSDIKSDSKKILHDIGTADSLSVESPVEVKHENHEVPVTTDAGGDDIASTGEPKPEAAPVGHKEEDGEGEAMIQSHKEEASAPNNNGNLNLKDMFLMDENDEGSESGTEEEQSAFMKELENFFKERSMEFKPPKFYGIVVNCLKLWRAVTRLGGYDKVTSCKLWRLVGESFKPPKTCTTVSWTFRGFYEKALLDYERHKMHGGELILPAASNLEAMHVDSKSPGSGRARRDAATRAMEGWHSQRVLGNGEVSDPIIKDKNAMSAQKRDKHVKSIGILKRKAPHLEATAKAARTKSPRLDTTVVDIGPPADWVKINVQKTKDCFEVYALVPGLLREEVCVQSDPAGRLVISGEPEHPDNPWGVTPFKKVVNLPARVDPHQTSAVVTLHGQLFVRVPFEQVDQ